MPFNPNPNRILHNHKIKCIDYLLLSILENPGQSQRFHTRRLHLWQHGTEDHHSGGTNIAYFNNRKYYRDILFTDVSPQTVKYYSYYGDQLKSKHSQIHLTPVGFDRANKLRIKLDLPEISWDSAGHHLSCKMPEPVVQ